MPLPALLIATAKTALGAAIAPMVSQARDVALSVAQDTLMGFVAGKMTVEEWASHLSETIDDVKNRIIDDSGLRFVGGQLRFAQSIKTSGDINVSFHLYFLDDEKKWQKAEGDSEIPFSLLTQDALNELKEKSEVIFEIE